ncbi:FAD:protein FMN transferase [Bacillus tuaregi]|uniref:FAD:protein FMN transferase n=1 Tax=Bacillus tuaregi TaxID=1816695 RepID=UPI0008F95A11|nr:FAD:protein FMN transferase [Bacillus tuaregi]
MIEILEGPHETNLDTLSIEAMNCTFYIAISNSEVPDWKQTVTAFLHYIDSEFSRFKTHNELWRFNEASLNSTVNVSPLLYDLLKKAEDYRMQTEGRFSVCMLTQLENHGYYQSFPFPAAKKATETLSFYKMEPEPFIFHGDGSITKKTEKKVDLGGIAKGYAVEAIAKWLQQEACARFGMVDGGGDIAVWSNGEKTWRIGVMDPLDEVKEIGTFTILNGGIATSNTIYRSWLQEGVQKSHLLDGRTAMPVQSSLIQATVITEHCLDAEIGAKICFMSDHPSPHTVLSKIIKNYQYVFVTTDKQVVTGRSS